MLLIFNLGRPDVLPVHDLGVRKGYQVAYRKRQMPTPEQLDRIGRGGHRTGPRLLGICGERRICWVVGSGDEGSIIRFNIDHRSRQPLQFHAMRRNDIPEKR